MTKLYINRQDNYTGQIETIESLQDMGCSVWDFRGLCGEYQFSDQSGQYYLSQRATADHYQENS